MNTTLPWHDPIVAEIHATRERLAEEYHDDLVAYSEAADMHCRALGFGMVESLRLRPSAGPITNAAGQTWDAQEGRARGHGVKSTVAARPKRTTSSGRSRLCEGVRRFNGSWRNG